MMKKCTLSLLLLLLVSLFMPSCKTVQVTNDTYKVKTDTCYITKYQRDSIWQRDSIYIKEKGDTIWIKEWHNKYIDNSRIDTIYLASNDTCYIENTITLPPEKYIPKWLIILLCITGVITLIVIIKFGIKLYLKFKA